MRKVKNCLVLIAAAGVLASCAQKGSGLECGNWNTDVYGKLDSVIVADGILGKNYDLQRKPYAVFDFDNTSIINDCEISLMHYMISNMSFKLKPEDMFSTITDCIPDIDVPVIEDKTVRMIASDISSDYACLYGKELSAISSSKEYQDFRAKLSALYFATEDCYEYSVCCEWILKLFKGMSVTEIMNLGKTSFDYYSSMEGVSAVTWTSPEMGESGTVSSTHYEGIAATSEMRDLYSTLKANGFDVYICSASLESVVESITCSETSGFDMKPEFVYGLRFSDSPDMITEAALDPDYIQTFRQGKTGAIKAYMAPSHGGRGPSIVAGDSNGDYNMLTDFDDMKVGLIIDCGNGGGIGRLAASGDPKYAVQSRDFARGVFVKSTHGATPDSQ